MFERAIQVASRVLGRIAAYIVIAMVLLVTYDMLARTLFNRATYFAGEISGYMLVATVFLGGAHTFRQEKHIAVTLLSSRLPQKVQARLELATLILSFFCSAIITWQGTYLVFTSLADKATVPSVLGTPYFIPQTVIPLGAAVLTLEIGLRIYQLGRSLYYSR